MYALAACKKGVVHGFVEFDGVDERDGKVESLLYMEEFGSHVFMEVEGRDIKIRRNRSHWKRRSMEVLGLGLEGF